MLLAMTCMLLVVLLTPGAALDMARYDLSFPHMPWEAVRLAASAAAAADPAGWDQEAREQCRTPGSSQGSLLLRLLQGATFVPGHDVSRSGGSQCAARLGVHADSSRWPRLLVTVQCACERHRCGGVHQCTTLVGPVHVLRTPSPLAPLLPATDMLPVGCVCAARASMPAQVIAPLIV